MKTRNGRTLTALLFAVLAFAQATQAFYDANLGRWVNRDPLGEPGSELLRGTKPNILGDGPSPYVFNKNNAVNHIDPLGLKVQVCCREVNVPGVMVRIGNAVGTKHCWLKTDTKSAGMGPADDGELPGSPCGTATKITDHSKETGECNEVYYVDEACVNKELEMGKSTGNWGLMNQCNSFVGGVISRCAKCPKPNPAPIPLGY